MILLSEITNLIIKTSKSLYNSENTLWVKKLKYVLKSAYIFSTLYYTISYWNILIKKSIGILICVHYLFIIIFKKTEMVCWWKFEMNVGT